MLHTLPGDAGAGAKTHAPVPVAAYSISKFCEAHNISRAMFYLLEKQGKAPRMMKIGKRRLISQEAAAEWRRAREAEC